MIERDKPKMKENPSSITRRAATRARGGRLTNQNGKLRYLALILLSSLPVISAFNYPTSGRNDDDGDGDDQAAHQYQQQPKWQANEPPTIGDSSLDYLAQRELSEQPANDQREDNQSNERLNYHENSDNTRSEKERFAIELLRLLHNQYGKTLSDGRDSEPTTNQGDAQSGEVQKKSDGRLPDLTTRQSSMAQLLGALGADGDLRRLIDWAQNSFNLASIGEIATQFVVSKLGGVNCGAIFRPDAEETLVPRFLLFNEHFVDVPYELPINPSATECIANGKFDPVRKTVVLVHGYLAGYTLVDGLTNIKNRLLDLNKIVGERAMRAFEMAHESNGSYVLTEDLDMSVRQHKYNVVIVDWFTGANPVPRANYIKAAVNAQVVGQLIARFLSAMVVRCGTPAANLQIIAHSLGCHVAGFTGKAMNRAGHRLGKITHLDPIGLCFGRLFSEPRLRLSPDDALDTQAVHVSLNLFDNPLDGAQANFLVNGGRDQIGCGGQSELKNSTSSSVSLLFDSEGGFTPCSHVRALALYEDDLSSNADQCQLVGYRCPNYEQYLAGKCGHCDTLNNQCRLMSLPPISLSFSKMNISPETANPRQRDLVVEAALSLIKDMYPNGIDKRPAANEIDKRADDGENLQSPSGQRVRLAKAVDRFKVDARQALAEGWTSLGGETRHRSHLSHLGEKFRNRVSMKHAELANETDTQSLYSDEIPSMPSTSTAVPTREVPGRYPNTVASSSSSSSSATTTTATTLAPSDEQPASRFQGDKPDVDLIPMPLGGQRPPAGSLLGPLYYLGTGPITPYCVNYYQFRVLISESRLQRLIVSNRLAPNKLASNQPPTSSSKSQSAPPPFNRQQNSFINKQAQRIAASTGRSILHMTIKLIDSAGHFFKGFTLKENARNLQRVHDGVRIGQQVGGARDNLVELTMLLNTTQSEPIRISESVISFYFHGIVLADRIELNYMSNISPGVRARYSSTLCPVAINDRHQLVRYVECNKIGGE